MRNGVSECDKPEPEKPEEQDESKELRPEPGELWEAYRDARLWSTPGPAGAVIAGGLVGISKCI